MRSLTSKCLASVATAAACLGAFSGAAAAIDNVYWEGPLDGFAQTAPLVVTSNASRTISGGTTCIRVYWTYAPRPPADDPICVNGVNALAQRYYTGFYTLYAGVSAAGANIRARVHFI